MALFGLGALGQVIREKNQSVVTPERLVANDECWNTEHTETMSLVDRL
jgi:hypothetical protein